MSSLRNAVKRITHKERSQPRARSHLGLLEKKKDYRKRAVNYHEKQAQLVAMRERAAFRNPDEFYMGMHSHEVRGGKHRMTNESRSKALEDTIGSDAVKMMKNQDLSYVRLERRKDQARIEKLQSSLHMMEGGNEDDGERDQKRRKHTIFVEDEKQAKDFDVATHFDTLPEFAGRAFNRPKVSTLVKAAKEAKPDDSDDEHDRPPKKEYTKKQKKRYNKMNRAIVKKAVKARSSAYAELEARTQRQNAMAVAEAHLATEKLVAGKGRKRKIKHAEDGKPAVYKWQMKRAR